MRPLLVVVLLALCAGPASAQSRCRLYAASQYNWTWSRGLYLDFEGSSLATLPVILGVGDGTAWRFAQDTPGFAFNTDYTLRAVVSPTTAQLYLNDVLV